MYLIIYYLKGVALDLIYENMVLILGNDILVSQKINNLSNIYIYGYKHMRKLTQ